MNDIEENRDRLRDLALHHIEPAAKKEDDSDAASATSHNTPSQRKHQRGGRKESSLNNSKKFSEEFEYIEPTPTNEETCDEAASANEQDAANPQRKHQRGGRKNKRSNRQDLEHQIPWSQRTGRLQSPYPEDEEGEEVEPDLRRVADEPKPPAQEKAPTPFETGIKAFNLRRAEQSGGKPIGVSVDRGEKTNGVRSESKKEKKAKKKTKKKTKKSKKKKEESSSDDSSSSSSESEEEEKRKPLAIRLDLNLELEIFLRAKVKGEITITFL